MLDDKLKNKINIKKNELKYIKEFIYKLNNEIDILKSMIISFNRKKVICMTIIKLLLFIYTTMSIIVIGSVCNVNLFIMLFSSMLLITINILINNFMNKLLNKKYNINQIKVLVRDKEILLNKYKDKEKIIINELNVVKDDYCKNKEIMLFTENINNECYCKDINYNTIPKVKKKTKKS